MGAPVETLHTFEWHEMRRDAEATFDKLAASTRGDSWLELRRGPLIELTTQWRVRTPTPFCMERRVVDIFDCMGGEEVLVYLGAASTRTRITTTRTFYVWRTSRRSGGAEMPPQPPSEPLPERRRPGDKRRQRV